MGDIIEIDDHRDHLVITLPDGVHVIPVRLVAEIAKGNHKTDSKTAQCLAAYIMDNLYD